MTRQTLGTPTRLYSFPHSNTEWKGSPRPLRLSIHDLSQEICQLTSQMTRLWRLTRHLDWTSHFSPLVDARSATTCQSKLEYIHCIHIGRSHGELP
jgi:hypothetical protein